MRVLLLISLLLVAACGGDWATKDHTIGVREDETEDPTDPDDDSPQDSDSDGMSNEVENTFEMDVNKSDSDHDLIGDGLEFAVDTGDPLDAQISPQPLNRVRRLELEDAIRNDRDSDGDGLGDTFENTSGLDASSADTDGDGYSDAIELIAGSDPFVASDRPERSAPPAPDGVNRVGAAPVDSDRDGLADEYERLNGTLTNSRDTDGDGFGDGIETMMGSDPTDVLSIPNFSVPTPPDDAM